jgi:hypothetical protein
MLSYLNELEAEKKVVILQALLGINVIINNNRIIFKSPNLLG